MDYLHTDGKEIHGHDCTLAHDILAHLANITLYTRLPIQFQKNCSTWETQTCYMRKGFQLKLCHGEADRKKMNLINLPGSLCEGWEGIVVSGLDGSNTALIIWTTAESHTLTLDCTTVPLLAPPIISICPPDHPL